MGNLDDQHPNAGAAAGIGKASSGQRSAIMEATRLVTHGNTTGAIAILEAELAAGHVLDDDTRENASILLARLYASQARFEPAVSYLPYLIRDVANSIWAAHILCARATELVDSGQYQEALAHIVRARALSTGDTSVRENVDRLELVVVPILACRGQLGADTSPGILFEVLHILIDRLRQEPNDSTLAHGTAIFAEWSAAFLESRTEHDTSGNWRYGADEMWLWAGRCWVLVAHSATWWSTWRTRIGRLRSSSAEAPTDDMRRLRFGALDRLQTTYAEYLSGGSDLTSPDIREAFRSHLLMLTIERRSAEALEIILETSRDIANSVGFFGPVAGVSLLEHFGRTLQLKRLAAADLSGHSLPENDRQRLTEAWQALRDCLSPIAPAYGMRYLHMNDEAIEYCKRYLHVSEARDLLVRLQLEQAAALLDSGNLEAARGPCLEAMHLAPSNQMAIELFAEIGKARTTAVFRESRRDYDKAIALAREDLAAAQNDERLKRNLAGALINKAEHVLLVLDEDTPQVGLARQFVALLLEVWQLTPDDMAEQDAIAAIATLAYAIATSGEISEPATFDVIESEIGQGERHFPGHPELKRLRAANLRTRALWYLTDPDRLQAVRANPGWIVSLASLLEQAWQLEDEHESGQSRQTAAAFALLSELYQPISGWPSTLTPYDSGLSIVARGLQLLPNDPLLRATQAELLRLKATAMVQHAGGFDDRPVPDHIKQHVLQLFAQAWRTYPHAKGAASAMATVCMMLDDLASARYYEQEVLRLDPSDDEAYEKLQLLQVVPWYEAARNDFNRALVLLDRRQYRSALAHLRRAEQAINRISAETDFPGLEELYEAIVHTLGVLQSYGF